MRKSPHGKILREEPKEQHLITIPKSCSLHIIVQKPKMKQNWLSKYMEEDVTMKHEEMVDGELSKNDGVVDKDTEKIELQAGLETEADQSARNKVGNESNKQALSQEGNFDCPMCLLDLLLQA